MKGVVAYLHQPFVNGEPGPTITIHFNENKVSAKTRDAIWELVKVSCEALTKIESKDKRRAR